MNAELIQNYFCRAVERFRNRIAVSQDDSEMSYEDLNIASDTAASDLMRLAKKTGVITGIYLDASIEYVVAVLGTLKAGGIFLPLNIRYPDHRLSETLRLAEPDIIITSEIMESELQERLRRNRAAEGSPSIYVVRPKLLKHRNSDGQEQAFSATWNKDANVGRQSELDIDACYLMSTSGSTGEPKVILGSHAGLCHFIKWEINEFKMNERVRGSFLSHPTFDVSLRDIFIPLSCGGTIVIPDEKTKHDPAALYRWFEDRRISLTHIVPTLFRLLTQAIQRHNSNEERCPSLEWVLIAGEPLYGSDVFLWNQVVGEHPRLVNIYGPSETTLAKIFYRIQASKLKANQIVPLGKPIDGAKVFVINGNRLCNAGEEGQIYIETKYRSKGYYKNPELTRSVFICNPVDAECLEPVYLTGDIGKWLDDGNLQFLGRRDAQVKLHGQRIELNEIEAIISQHPQVQLVAVAVKGDEQGSQRLIAHIVPKKEGSLTVEAMRRFLIDRIADYMIPNIYVFSSSLPLTHSGKIDRRNLPDPAMTRPCLEQSYVGATNEIEIRLVELWRSILGFAEIGIDDNFFDLGGNSILAARLAGLIGDWFKREIPVMKIFEYPRIRLFANYLREENRVPAMVENQDHRAQQRRSRRMLQRKARQLNR